MTPFASRPHGETAAALRRRCARSGALLLGVTGGIASGKSTVSRMLELLGAPLIDFDLLARRVVLPGTAAFREIVAHFGPSVVGGDGTLDRRRLARVVFRDEGQRRKLESFTHPEILRLFVDEADRLRAGRPAPVIQVSVPLLLELELQGFFDRLLVVYAEPRQQVERLMARDGIGRGEALKMLAAQMPIDAKLSFADHVVYNTGTPEKTREAVAGIWRELLRLRKGAPPAASKAPG